MDLIYLNRFDQTDHSVRIYSIHLLQKAHLVQLLPKVHSVRILCLQDRMDQK